MPEKGGEMRGRTSMERDKDKCQLGEISYSSGADVCDDEYCYVCRGGEWEMKTSNFIGL